MWSACAASRPISTPSSITASTPRRSRRASSPRPGRISCRPWSGRSAPCSGRCHAGAPVSGAIGAWKGPLHGGAPGPALDMVFEIGDASRAEVVLRRKIEGGEKLMGLAHRVSRVRDPRADVLGAAAERLFTRAGDMSLYTLARSVEATALRLLDEYKAGRRLQNNVEVYTALLLHGRGLHVPLFTPTFATSRVSGWVAPSMEQARATRIIRPQSEYVGPRDRRWMPIAERQPDLAGAGGR